MMRVPKTEANLSISLPAHVQDAIGWAGYAARTAQSQGYDLFGQGANLLLKGSEYAAKYNLNETVPFDPSWYRCEAVLVDGPWSTISNMSRGISGNAPVWDLVWYEYGVKRGLSMPWTKKAKEAADKLSQNPGTDNPGWGDLVWSY
jgi:hypothetical protein